MCFFVACIFPRGLVLQYGIRFDEASNHALSGIRQYFGEQFNRFDFVIVALNLVEIIIAKVFRVKSLSGLSAFRSFRLIKVFRLARSWVVLRDLIQTIGKSLDSLVHFSFVLALFIFIYALLGMQFFAGKMWEDKDHTEVSRANFDTFWWSIVTVFQVIGGMLYGRY